MRQCNKCQLSKPKAKTKEEMCITITPQKPFDVVILDTIGPLPKSDFGNEYAVTLICDLSKYLICVPVPNKETQTIAKAIIDHCILIFGPIKNIRTDLGTEYKNQIVAELCKMLNINHNFSTAYHHESVGTIERNHRVFNEYLRTYIENDSNWDHHLKYFVFCYNTSYNAC